LDAPGDQDFTIYNLTNDPIPPGTVWVNGKFVRQIDGISPKGQLTVAYGNVIQAGPGTADLKQSGQTISHSQPRSLRPQTNSVLSRGSPVRPCPHN
jgi:hypothetical protein